MYRYVSVPRLVALILAVLSLLLFDRPLASAASDLVIGNYQLVSKTRVSRTAYDYIFSAEVINNGAEYALGVNASLTSLASTTQVIDGALDFGDVPPGTKARSKDTFTVRIDRLSFDQSALSWNVAAIFSELVYGFESPSAPVQKSWGGGAEPIPVVTKKYIGQVSMPQTEISLTDLRIESGIAGTSVVSETGHFKTEMNSNATTLLTVVDGNGNAYLMKLFPKSDEIVEENPVIDAKSTAISLVALQPGIVTGEPNIDAMILEILRNQPTIQALADQIVSELASGTFKLNGDSLSAPVLEKMGAVLDAINHMTVQDALSFNFFQKMRYKLALIFDAIIPDAYAGYGDYGSRVCSDFNISTLHDKDGVDHDGVCLSGTISKPGEVSTFKLQNRLARWSLLGLERADGSLEHIDWVPPRNFHVPNLTDILSDILTLGASGAGEYFNKIFKFSDENLFYARLDFILRSYYGNGSSSTDYTFPASGSYDLSIVGAHANELFSTPHDLEVVESFILSGWTEVVIPFISVALEVKSTEVKQEIYKTLTDSSAGCKTMLDDFIYSKQIIPQIAEMGTIFLVDGAKNGTLFFVEKILLDKFLSMHGITVAACYTSNMINSKVLVDSISYRLLKIIGSGGVGAMVDAINAGVNTFNASASTVLFVSTVVDSNFKPIDSYTAVVLDESTSGSGIDISGNWTATFQDNPNGTSTVTMNLSLNQAGTAIAGTNSWWNTNGKSGTDTISGTINGTSIEIQNTVNEPGFDCDGTVVEGVVIVSGERISILFNRPAIGTCPAIENLQVTFVKGFVPAPIPSNLTITELSLPDGTVGAAYSQPFTASGGLGTLTWSAPGGLPQWLSLNGAGAISGTPTTAGIYGFTVEVTDETGFKANKTFTITVAAPVESLAITTSTMSNGTVGSVYSQSLFATGGTGDYTWSISSGDLPDGLTLNNNVISGTPITAGTSGFTISVTDAGDSSVGQNFSITINGLAIPAATLKINAPSMTWTPRVSGTDNGLQAFASNGSKMIAAGMNGTILSSLDGLNWTQENSGTSYNFYGATYANGLFVLVGAAYPGGPSVIVTSPDGASWTERNLDFVSSGLNNVVYGNGVFVTVGNHNVIYTSIDGIYWSFRNTVSGGQHLNEVKFLNNKFVAVGHNGRVIHSSDGITWSNSNTGTDFQLHGAAFGNGKYVFSGQKNDGSAGVMLVSTDLTTWTSIDPVAAFVRRLAFSGYRFAGAGGAILASTDGMQWTVSANVPTAEVGWDGRQFVAIGVNGTILTSSDSIPDGTVGSAYNASLSAEGGTGPYNWSISSGTLPSGLSLNGTTGVISGTPTTAGTYGFTVIVTDAGAFSTSASLVISLNVSNPVGQQTYLFSGNMNSPRSNHTATVLQNGRLLIAGGEDGHTAGNLASAETYDPVTETFSFTDTMNIARSGHTATLLQNGKVLIVGGYSYWPNIIHGSAELYDPATGTFSLVGNLHIARSQHTATLLNNGKVLIVGGNTSGTTVTNTAELFDPATGTFSYTGNMHEQRAVHTEIILQDGRVLIVGGSNYYDALSSSEVYDPVTGSFVYTGSMHATRFNHAATLLESGLVLITGGHTNLNIAELYNPITGVFTLTGNMVQARAGHHSTRLMDGRVLLTGGVYHTANWEPLNASEIFDPSSGSFSATDPMNSARGQGHTSTLLNNGNVLITGGYTENNGINITNSAEKFVP